MNYRCQFLGSPPSRVIADTPAEAAQFYAACEDRAYRNPGKWTDGRVVRVISPDGGAWEFKITRRFEPKYDFEEVRQPEIRWAAHG